MAADPLSGELTSCADIDRPLCLGVEQRCRTRPALSRSDGATLYLFGAIPIRRGGVVLGWCCLDLCGAISYSIGTVVPEGHGVDVIRHVDFDAMVDTDVAVSCC